MEKLQEFVEIIQEYIQGLFGIDKPLIAWAVLAALVLVIFVLLMTISQLVNTHRSGKQLKMLGSIDEKLDSIQEEALVESTNDGEAATADAATSGITDTAPSPAADTDPNTPSDANPASEDDEVAAEEEATEEPKDPDAALSYSAYMEKYFFGREEPFEAPAPAAPAATAAAPAEPAATTVATIPVAAPAEGDITFNWQIPKENPFPDAKANDLSALLKDAPAEKAPVTEEQPVTTVEEILASMKQAEEETAKPAEAYFKPRAFDITNTGKSGKQYTIAELQAQIRE